MARDYNRAGVCCWPGGGWLFSVGIVLRSVTQKYGQLSKKVLAFYVWVSIKYKNTCISLFLDDKKEPS